LSEIFIKANENPRQHPRLLVQVSIFKILFLQSILKNEAAREFSCLQSNPLHPLLADDKRRSSNICGAKKFRNSLIFTARANVSQVKCGISTTFQSRESFLLLTESLNETAAPV
jgi:hypothetical protein